MSLLINVTYITLIQILKGVLQWKSVKVVYYLLTDVLSPVAMEHNVFRCLTSCSVVEI